jgi:N-methylhydantoinase A/oxoprolinase/acetone carboxylase beta subunit
MIIRRLLAALFFAATLAAQTFIQMSDPQFGMFSKNQNFEHETVNYEFAIATANRLKPAFVVITGDLINDCGPRGLATLDLARAVVDVSAAHVSRGVRLVSVQRGRDPKGYVLYAYGGMGPVVAALVAEELGIRRVVIPPLPGLFSALGLLVADLKREYRETGFLPVAEDAPDRVEEAFSRMEAEARRELAGYGSSPDEIEWERHLEMRSRGQGFELRAAVDLDGLRAEGHRYLVDLFEHVIKVALPAHVIEAQLDDGYDVATRRYVEMVLSNGETIAGHVAVYRPIGRDRLTGCQQSRSRSLYPAVVLALNTGLRMPPC